MLLLYLFIITPWYVIYNSRGNMSVHKVISDFKKKNPLVKRARFSLVMIRGALFGWLVGFLTSSSTTRLYRSRAPRQSVWQFFVLPHTRQRGETMTSVSAGRIILTPTQPVGSGRPQRESNPGPPQQESRAPPTELPCPHRRGTLHW